MLQHGGAIERGAERVAVACGPRGRDGGFEVGGGLVHPLERPTGLALADAVALVRPRRQGAPTPWNFRFQR